MNPKTCLFCLLWLLPGLIGNGLIAAQPRVVITEILYHPVEEPAFQADGSPVFSLYEDVHEFIEIHNPGSTPLDLSGWKLTGGVSYTFPLHSTLGSGEYRVIAKDPSRLAAVPEYGLVKSDVFGPYLGQLSNTKETIRLQDASGDLVDAVSYSAEFPWAMSADALGGSDDFTGINPLNYQYRGRSLERVSWVHPANDPANWIASPLPGNPSPGMPNAVRRATPKPIIIHFSVVQNSDEAAIIRSNQPVRIQGAFSGTDSLANVTVEWFIDDINATNESRTITPMAVAGVPALGRFTGVLPGQSNRSVVRFRFRANRGEGDEVVSPRADDPFGWHAYFVTPTRPSTKPIYDCFISTASLAILNGNISQNPKRITTPDPPGRPRISWNATEPAIVVVDGVVYDIRMRHHGSRYNRRASRNSFKWQFPGYQKFNGVTGIFETDKGNDFIVGHNLFIEAGFPVSHVRYVDLYLNSGAVMQRLEQGEFDGAMLEAFHEAQERLNPGTPREASGEIYKTVGTIDLPGEGPYGRGDGRKLVKPGYWTDLQMYDWTFALQNNGWRGSYYFKQMIDAFWVARGDTPTAPNPNIPAMRAYFTNHFDLDEMLNYIAVENWSCPWDDTTQNHFLWQRRNGQWGMLPWDCDAWFGRGDNTPASSSIYIGEVGDRNNNFRGPNFFKDGFIKAFRSEYRERLYLLNNTLLHPDNITALGFGSIRSFADARFAAVNTQCGLGPFQRPAKPLPSAPANTRPALPPMSFQASAYSHSARPAPAHAKTLWEIRSATGNFRTPVWKVTSATNLTAILIPFEQLEFGQTYFWRCTYYDAADHPSVVSDESSFVFGPAPSQSTLAAIDGSTRWKYNQTANLTGVNWMAAGYDDSSWPSGASLLAVETAALPESIRTPLVIGRSTYYFRNTFNFPGDPRGAKLSLRHVIDDGCIVYLNGAEVLRTAMPAGAVTYATLASRNVGDAVYEGPFTISPASLVPGENVLAVELHQSATNSSDIVFGLALTATIPAVSGDLVLNEIAARNRGSVRKGDGTPDWIELFNNTSEMIDLSGMSLSDDVLAPGKYVFPPKTRLAAQGFLTVWCDGATDAPGLHTGFGLSDQGQTVALFAPFTNGFTLRDYVAFGPQIDDLTIGRVPGGSGSWQLTTPTPDAPNRAAALGSPATLKINEWMASPASGDDWLELFNPSPQPVALGGLFLSDTPTAPTNSRMASLSFIAPQGFTEFRADQNPQNGADHANFKLSAAGESIFLISTNGLGVIDSVAFGPQASGVSQGRLPDGAASLVFFPATASPGESNHLPMTNVVIQEVLSHSDPPLEDAIELFNPTASPVDLSGWFLSDELPRLAKYRIPHGTRLEPGGFKVFYEDQFNADTNSPASFSLNSARGDNVYLAATDAQGNLTGYRTHVDFGPAANGVSFGRVTTSLGIDFTALNQRTFGADTAATLAEFRAGAGAANAGPKIGPIVISEIMYHPPDFGTNDNTIHEFIELHNLTAEAVPLFDPVHPTHAWRLRDAVDYDFPLNVTMPPSGLLLVVSFDPATNAAAQASFQAKYGVGAPLFGPFRGKLDNRGESVRLYRPDSPQTLPGPELGLVPYILVDRVTYADLPPWPASADGTGPSLQRLNVFAYGNEPTNWFASGFTPGAPPAPSNPAELDSDRDGMPDAWESKHGLQVGINDAGLDPDRDGLTNLQEFLAGTDPQNAASSLKLEAFRLASEIRLRFAAQADRAYSVQVRVDLVLGAWQTFTNIAARPEPRTVEVSDSAGFSPTPRYYRLTTPPVP